MCDTCKHKHNDSNSRPCNTCIIWHDGYLTYQNYYNESLDFIKKIKSTEVKS